MPVMIDRTLKTIFKELLQRPKQPIHRTNNRYYKVEQTAKKKLEFLHNSVLKTGPM